MPARRTFGLDESSGGDIGTRTPIQTSESFQATRNSARVSFSALRKPSLSILRRSTVDEETGEGSVVQDKPAIPSALQQSEAYTTPLPTLSMVVLSIVSVILLAEAVSCDYMRVPCRPCLESSCRPMFLHPSYCSWYKVRSHPCAICNLWSNSCDGKRVGGKAGSHLSGYRTRRHFIREFGSLCWSTTDSPYTHELQPS